MIARHRGDTRRHSRWRPVAPATVPPTSAGLEPLVDDAGGRQVLDQSHASPRRSRALIALATVIGVAVIAGAQRSGGTVRAPLPSSPQHWIEQWTSASLENPARVCQHLFATALAAAFKADTGRSCTRFYTSIRSSSLRIRHVLEDGPTATVEARQVAANPKWGYFTIVLSRVPGGWQAVDMIPGGSISPR
jgi:hypothetical protein